MSCKSKLKKTLFNFYSILFQNDFLDGDDSLPVRTQPFIWRTLQQHNHSTNAEITCRNSVQGKVLIVDDRGLNFIFLN